MVSHGQKKNEGHRNKIDGVHCREVDDVCAKLEGFIHRPLEGGEIRRYSVQYNCTAEGNSPV